MDLCSDEELAGLVKAIERAEDGGLAPVALLIERYPGDPRLHFMRGSILTGQKQALEAHAALSRAVELAPDFHLARYQLGFFELTSGEVDRALSTWGPLLRLPADAPLRLFVEGLTHMVRDEFPEAIGKMREGITRNRENEPLNHDIRLLVGECEKLAGGEPPDDAREDGGGPDLSATSIILGQFARGPSTP